jgi:peptidoglycan/LPS O-acetylase OafA/YrhL
MGIKYNPALDGVRAIAALSVAFLHTSVPHFQKGAVGVDIFFVLSGLLITSILLQERSGDFGAALKFWWRRALRLMPALFLMVLVVCAAAPIVFPGRVKELWVSAVFALTYSTDIAGLLGRKLDPLTHTWTLAFEFQFYLLWPFVLQRLRKFRRPDLLLLIIWGMLALTQVFLDQFGGAIQQFSIFFQAGNLVLGSALAFWKPLKPYFGWLGLALLCIYLFTPVGGSFQWLQDLPVRSIGAALFIGGLQAPSRLASVLSWKPLVAVGTISYGIYLWHRPCAVLADGLYLDWVGTTAVTLLWAGLLALGSYFTVERWGRWLKQRGKAAAPVAAAAG